MTDATAQAWRELHQLASEINLRAEKTATKLERASASEKNKSRKHGTSDSSDDFEREFRGRTGGGQESVEQQLASAQIEVNKMKGYKPS